MEQDDQNRMTARLVGSFILVLVTTAVIERVLNHLVNRFVLPHVMELLLPEQTAKMLGTDESLLMLVALFVVFLLAGISWLLPIFAGQCRDLMRLIIDAVTQRTTGSSNAALPELSAIEALTLFGAVVGLLVLYIGPYIVGAVLYARRVVREMNAVRDRQILLHEQYDARRNLMLSDIAHDLRNPITTVNGYAKALEDGMVTDPEQEKKYLHAIQQKSTRMNDLITLLFEYAKLRSTGFELDQKRTDLCELVRENAALMFEDAESHGMEMIAEIPEKPCFIRADSLQVSRAVTNLITNAIRHNESGAKILVRVENRDGEEKPLTYEQLKQGARPAIQDARWDRTRGEHINIIIADSGEPIPQHIAAHIFEPFAMGDSSRSSKGGSGLGLSIAATIVARHGWKLGLVTDYPGYTKAFVITIRE